MRKKVEVLIVRRKIKGRRTGDPPWLLKNCSENIVQEETGKREALSEHRILELVILTVKYFQLIISSKERPWGGVAEVRWQRSWKMCEAGVEPTAY